MKKIVAATALAAAFMMPATALPSAVPGAQSGLLPTAVAAPTQTLTPAQQRAVAKQLFRETNEVRRRAGKKPVRWDEALACASTNWSTYLARTGKLAHDKKHIMGPYHAENVYWVSSNQPQRAVKSWTNSPGHYRNMVGPYSRVGIGMAQDHKGGWYVTQRFLR